MSISWWQEEVVYQIYPRSFQDSNGDGIGDIPGIIQRLDELRELGVGIIWLSPVYSSPMEDNGYDISDYRNINPEFGSMEDMERLIAEAKARDIRIVMDLVINHTSSQHEWFQKSRRKEEPYTDYYIWRDAPKKGKMPNNWTSFFAEQCWVFDQLRGQYYLHLFAKGQPDLNYNNPKVLEEVKNIMRFWLDKGIAGFRCDVINVIFKSSLKNGKRSIALVGHEHYLSQEGSHRILQELNRDVLSHYDCFTVGETVLVTPEQGRRLCNPQKKELDMIFSFQHMEADQFFLKWFKRKFSPKRFAQAISMWQTELDWNANYFENHDQLRSVSRFGDDKSFWRESATMLATLLLSLRGTPFLYQGQEIGMTNGDFKSMEEIQDVESHNVNELLKTWPITRRHRWKMIRQSTRDNCRTPFQWEDDVQAGFSSALPWLKINPNFTHINLADQKEDNNSVWNYYKNMIAFRAGSKILKQGDFTPLEIRSNRFIYRRSLEGKSLLCLFSFTGKEQKVSYQGKVLFKNSSRKTLDGKLMPYEAWILEE